MNRETARAERWAPVSSEPVTTRSVWLWRRWTRWPLTPTIVLVAALALAVDAITAWQHVTIGSLGRVEMSPALPIGIVLALLVGLRRLGLDRANLLAWREFLLVCGGVLAFGIWQYTARIAGFQEAVGLVIAALDEELVYRLAVLILVGAACAALVGRNWRNAEDWGFGPGLVALLASGLMFTLLPGHVAQMSNTLHALPFAALAIVLGYAVLRTGALLPAVMVHALLNLVTIAALNSNTPAAWRSAFAASALLALVGCTILAGRRLGILQRVAVEAA